MKSGGCECAQVTYALHGDVPALAYACHCLHCQTRSGAAFSQQVLVPAADFTIMGRTVSCTRENGGVRVEEVFCADCFTRIYNRNSGLDGVLLVYAGTLTDSHQLMPIAHIWTDRKQPWIAIDASIPSFAQSPTPEEFGKVLENARKG